MDGTVTDDSQGVLFSRGSRQLSVDKRMDAILLRGARNSDRSSLASAGDRGRRERVEMVLSPTPKVVKLFTTISDRRGSGPVPVRRSRLSDDGFAAPGL